MKTWNQANLEPNDFDFSGLKDFPGDELRVAWLYEVQRELGSNNPPYLVAWETHEHKKRKARLKAHLQCEDCFSKDYLELTSLLALLPELPPDQIEIETEATLNKMLNDNPDMTLTESDEYMKKREAYNSGRQQRLNAVARAEVYAVSTTWKPTAPREPKSILKSYRQQEFAAMKCPDYSGIIYGSRSCSSIHALEIDWTLKESELLTAFRNWLQYGDHPEFRPNYFGRSDVGKRRSEGWRSRLQSLAIYRLSEAGITRTKGLEMLRVGKMSAPNWAHAQSGTRKRINEQMAALRHSAWNQGNGSRDDWRGEFIKPFPL